LQEEYAEEDFGKVSRRKGGRKLHDWQKVCHS
jgi:hypothetical protein